MNEQETKAMLSAMEKDQKKGNFWSPEDGENQLRFLPPVKANNEVLPYFHHKVHWIDGAPYECAAQSGMDKNGNFHEAVQCPACKKSKYFYKIGEKDSEEREIAYDLSAKNRYIFRIVDRSKSEESQAEPEFYEVGPTIYKKFFAVMKSGRYGNIVHPIDGRDFIVDKQGAGRRTNYDNSAPDPNVTKIFDDKDQLKEVLTKIKAMPYESLIEFSSVESIQQAIDDYFDNDKEEASVVESAKVAKVESIKEETSEEKNSDDVSSDDIDDILGEFM